MNSLLETENEKSIHDMENIQEASPLKIQRTTVRWKGHGDRVLG